MSVIVYCGIIENLIFNYTVFSKKCEEEDGKYLLEIPTSYLDLFYNNNLYPFIYIDKNKIDKLNDMEMYSIKARVVYSTNKDEIFTIVDHERLKHLELAKRQVELLEKPIQIKNFE